jgi:hypothetical protein
MATFEIQSGIQALDKVLQGIRLGDNVVWLVDELEDYRYFAEPFTEAAIATGTPNAVMATVEVTQPGPRQEGVQNKMKSRMDFLNKMYSAGEGKEEEETKRARMQYLQFSSGKGCFCI